MPGHTSPAEVTENGRKPQAEDSETGSVSCVDRLGSGAPARSQLAAVSGMSLGCLLDGIVIAYSSPAIHSLQAKDSGIELDHHHISWIGSVHTLGAILGCLLSVPSLRHLGRKGSALYVMSLAYLVGFLCIGVATTPEMIILGRFSGGVGLGLTLSVTPVYLVEVSSVERRGLLGAVPPLFTQIGVMLTYTSGCYLSWRMLALSGVSLVLVFLLCVYLIPESPLYLAGKARFEEAEQALVRLGRGEDSVKFFKDIQTDMNVFDLSLAKSWRQYLDPRVYKPLLASLALMFFFQATGYNTILAYSLILFRESGLAEEVSVIQGTIILLSACVALLTARICNRKSLLIVSSLGTSLSLIILGLYYYCRQSSSLPGWSWVPLISIILMILSFMIGFGAVAWTVMAEILPTKVRGDLYPFTVAFTWLWNFGFAKSFIYIQRLVGSYGAFWSYAGLTLVGVIFIIFCLPETRNKSEEEIGKFFNRTGTESSEALGIDV